MSTGQSVVFIFTVHKVIQKPPVEEAGETEHAVFGCCVC